MHLPSHYRNIKEVCTQSNHLFCVQTALYIVLDQLIVCKLLIFGNIFCSYSVY